MGPLESFPNLLVEIDKGNEDFYTQNKIDYLQKLDDLDADIRDSLAEAEDNRFIVFHPAWGYFAKEYGLEQIPIEVEGNNPGSAQIADVIEEAKEYDIKVVFVSPQFDTQKAQVIAEEIGGTVVLIDPLARDYISNLQTVTGQLIQGLG